jgi:hypothetical protein
MKRLGVASTAFLLFVPLGGIAFGYAQQEPQAKPEQKNAQQQQAQQQHAQQRQNQNMQHRQPPPRPTGSVCPP